MTQLQNINQPTLQNATDPLSWRLTLAKEVFQTISLISLPAFLAASYYAVDQHAYIYLPIYFLLIIFIFTIAFSKRVSDRARMWGIMGVLYFFVLLDYYTEGRGSLARSFLLVFAFMGTVLFGRRGAIISTIIVVLTMVAFAYVYIENILPDYQVSSRVLSGWVSNIFIVTVIILMIVYSVDYLVREMAAFLARSRQLNQIIEAERGNLEQRVNERTAAAEFARSQAEASASEAMAARKDLEMQIWLATGQTRLADAMRGEQNIPQLASNVIARLCQYFGAQAGALYVLENNTLKLAGNYALLERPGFDGTIQLGEGLVGQAAQDRKIYHLEEIPPDTMVISSGLVNLKPRQLVAAPFLVNGEVVGVIEMATLSGFSQPHFDLLDRTSESIGIAFRTEQTRDRLADLLAKTQHQAEELQAQEEELRFANEELQIRARKIVSPTRARIKGSHGEQDG